MGSEVMGNMVSSKMIHTVYCSYISRCVIMYAINNYYCVIFALSPLDPRFARSIPAGVDRFFSERKYPEYDFLRQGSKAVGPVS